MRYWFLILIFSFSFAKVLELPVEYDPFLIKKQTQPSLNPSLPKKEEIHLELIAIFNNKANINGNFYKIGDIIKGYKVVDIKSNYVVLKNSKKTLILPLVKSKVLKMESR